MITEDSGYDFTVYRVHKVPGIQGAERTRFDKTVTVATDLEVNQAVQLRIVTIPDLEDFTIYDGPYKIGLIYGMVPLPENECYFVHYRCSHQPRMTGPGKVMIVNRETGKVIYDGTDGVE
jgi:hypothetical protein